MGDGTCTAWPYHKADLSLAWLLKVLNIFCNGDNKNVLPQLADPTFKMFLNSPLPLVKSSLMVTVKATDSALFLLKGVSEYTIDVQT